MYLCFMCVRTSFNMSDVCGRACAMCVRVEARMCYALHLLMRVFELFLL